MTLSIKACAEKLKRARNVIRCLDAIKKNASEPFIYMEIGTCFKEDEGLSTYVAARFLKENGLQGKVFSHEMKPENIRASKDIVSKYDATLMEKIDWVMGNSAVTVPQSLETVDAVHFAFVDGGGHPLYNIYEFEALWEKLSPNGLILVDDCNYLPPSPAYEGRRDFGKAQLIMPFLMMVEYVNYQLGVTARQAGKEPDAAEVLEKTLALPSMSPFMKAVMGNDNIRSIARRFQDMDFALVGGDQLVIGGKEAMSRWRNG